jgi:hypothetical protein
MRLDAALYLTALALLAGAGCAGSSGKDPGAGPAPIDTIHIRSGDTLPPATPADTAADSTK